MLREVKELVWADGIEWDLKPVANYTTIHMHLHLLPEPLGLYPVACWYLFSLGEFRLN